MALHDLHADRLYHLATPDEWAAAQVRGSLSPSSLETEGFVHCSWGRQVAGTVAKHFARAAEVLALEVDAAALAGAELVEEDSYGSGQAFPHVYGPIPVAAVRGATPVAQPG